ncbi:MAG: alkaline shock response membrane anchor protein AmaP [Lentisphaeraceae bacterium]|nr:alkaline shock response membrane anchor protein AmaP [Lentisphaeraceae bacterium]
MREFFERFEFYDSELDFFYGLGAALVVLILARLLGWMIRSKKCPGISIPGEQGNLFVTTAAVEDFIIRILADVDDMLIDKVRLQKRGSRYGVVITLRVSAESNVSELRPIIEQRIIQMAESKIGIDSISEVNILLKNFSAKESQINKRHKLAMKDSTKLEDKAIEAEVLPN